MKVSFWSPIQGSSAVTSNLASISLMISTMYRYKCLIIENHLQKNKINHFIKPRTNKNMIYENSNYYKRYTGMESVLFELSRNSNSLGEPDYQDMEAMIRSTSSNIFGDNLFHISNDNRMEKTIFDMSINSHILTLLEACKLFSDLIFIDTESSNNLSTKYILHEADLIVVNLLQEPQSLYNFFKNHNSIRSRCLFLLNDYDEHSYFNLKKISQLYEINKSDIAIIPHCKNYKKALEHGELISFLLYQSRYRETYNNNCVTKNIIDATQMIHDRISYELKKNNRIKI